MSTRKLSANFFTAMHFTTVLLFVAMFMPQPAALADETGLTIGLRYESLGLNSVGPELELRLPMQGFEAWSMNISYTTSRLLIPWSPSLLPADYGNLGLRYHFTPTPWLEPYLGAQLRLAGLGIKSGSFPELSQVPASALAAGLDFGCLFRVADHFEAFFEVGTNYPASFAIPYLSWGLGSRYRF